MMKRTLKTAIALALTVCMSVSMLSACAVQRTPEEAPEGSISEEQTTTAAEASSEPETDIPETDIPIEITQTGALPYAGERPILVSGTVKDSDITVVPSVAPYTISPNLDNIDNLQQFYFSDDAVQKLAQNGFVVGGDSGREFFEVYENNRYNMIPSFVTVDSLMHTYHLYFSYLLKNIERDYLCTSLTRLSRRMLDNSLEQYRQLKGSEWESAAQRNAAFFTVGAKLLDDGTPVDAELFDLVSYELDNIRRAEGIVPSKITGTDEDYTQYKPRGYYAGSTRLEAYFRAMMWYGRIHFTQEKEDLDRSALLMTKALCDDADAYSLWEGIYAVTSFFAGASDDLSVSEYAPLILETYGESLTTAGLIGDADAFDRFHAATAALSAPQINSIPINDGESNVILGFRFMGQRFTIDAAIMQNLIYSRVGADSSGTNRMLPDVLDVPAALGSDTALRILGESGATAYESYTENMDRLRETLAAENGTLWSASLYASWLNTLRPLLTKKGEGYPMFMQNEEWLKKDLECFAGSFTELKHDTILYSKQVIAEMGGGDDWEIDYRGYVQPEPLVYARFATLTDLTAQGLEQYGMLRPADEENLSRLSYIANQLLTISQKELRDETLTNDEYEFIESYGGTIEHFWYEALKEEQETISSQEFPAALVVDIATDPNGQVLEAATLNPCTLYVVVKVDGTLRIATGSVYSFYQFPWSMDRMTDQKWRELMGVSLDREGNYRWDRPIEQPEWTASYRIQYE
ncbi:MAG: DUF3160 domain-containing protein [Roseburia sp.]|nr:DUF3160 domain-containing protein [Roseburia sp.]